MTVTADTLTATVISLYNTISRKNMLMTDLAAMHCMDVTDMLQETIIPLPRFLYSNSSLLHAHRALEIGLKGFCTTFDSEERTNLV